MNTLVSFVTTHDRAKPPAGKTAGRHHHAYKLTEIVGTSHEGVEPAIQAGFDRASKSNRNVRWFEVGGIRGFIDREGSTQYQAALKPCFTLAG